MNPFVLRRAALGAMVALLGAVAGCGPDRQRAANDSQDARLSRLEARVAADSAARARVPAHAADSAFGTRPEDAVARVRSYLAALREREFARARALWDTGAGDSATFARAHGDTTVNSFEVGEPGDVGAAAGSRYVEVPVVMRGTTPDRPPLLLHGRVTLRRSVVDGASDAQRRWRISRIEWSSNAKPAQR